MLQLNDDFERWEPIPWTDGRYTVSSRGRVYDEKRRVHINSRTNAAGYAVVLIRDANGEWSNQGVHMIVADVFWGYCPPGYELVHKNGDKTDNRIANLEYRNRWRHRSDDQFVGDGAVPPPDGCDCLDGEVWRDVPGYGGWYIVSNRGRVWAFKSSRLLSQADNGWGYLYVGLYHGNRRDQRKLRTVHRLVAETFLGPCPHGSQVNHKDGDKTNNTLDNLEYMTPAENVGHAINTGLFGSNTGMGRKLRANQAVEIRERYAAGGTTYKELALEYGVSQLTILQIVNRKTWKNAEMATV